MSWGIGDRVGVAVGIGNISSFLSKSIQSRGPQPSLVLDFAGTGTLDSRITFTRSTTATYYNSSGVLSTAAIDVPRFDYNPSTKVALGLLIEQSSTNLQIYSNVLDNNAVTVGLTISATAGTSPDGTNNAWSYIESNISAQHYTRQNTPFNITSGAVYTRTMFFKQSVGSRYALFGLTIGSDSFGAVVDLSAGTILGGSTGTCTFISAQIISVGNGWYRCSVTGTASTAFTVMLSWEGLSNTYAYAFGPVYLGDGVSGILAFGRQVEAIAFPTSYIPTVESQVTRASDNASITGTNFSSVFNNEQGVVYCKTTAVFQPNNAGPQIYKISATGGDNIQEGWYSAWGGTSLVYVNPGNGYIQSNEPTKTTGTLNTIQKAMYYSPTGSSISSDGYAPNSTYTTPSSRTNIGGQSLVFGGASPLWIAKFALYPQALTNAQLIALTT